MLEGKILRTRNGFSTFAIISRLHVTARRNDVNIGDMRLLSTVPRRAA